MKEHTHRINEAAAARAFTAQSSVFDKIYSSNTIIQYKRKRVREHVFQYIEPNSNILELNAGTGEDAVYFAQRGHLVHASDISAGMLEILDRKVNHYGLSHSVSSELCSFTTLEELQNRGPFDLIFSNFAGLNCTPELSKVLASFCPLLNPGGVVTLVLLPKFCLWETLLVFKGKFKTAFRRFFNKKGARSHIEGEYFTCWYYSPSYVISHLKAAFDLLSIEGLCTIVPPSYIEHFAEKHPRFYHRLCKKEDQLKTKWPWKYIGDYYIISFKKKVIG